MCALPPPLLQPNVTAFDRTFTLRPGLAAIASAVADAVGGRVPWLPSGLYSGDGTAYSEAVPNTGKGFACSYRYLNDWASTHFAAINRPMVSGGLHVRNVWSCCYRQAALLCMCLQGALLLQVLTCHATLPSSSSGTTARPAAAA
jgi:hypothetical protein